jgi:hypothetical protein
MQVGTRRFWSSALRVPGCPPGRRRPRSRGRRPSMPRTRPAPRSMASRSLAVSGVAPTAPAHAVMSSSLGSCLRVSIFDTFDCCQPSISARRAPLRPALTRSAFRASASRPRSRWYAGVVNRVLSGCGQQLSAAHVVAVRDGLVQGGVTPARGRDDHRRLGYLLDGQERAVVGVLHDPQVAGIK